MSAFTNARENSRYPSGTILIPSKSKSVTVVFGSNQNNTNYNIFLTPYFDSYVYVSAKRIDGFDITIKNTSSQDSYLSWMIN